MITMYRHVVLRHANGDSVFTDISVLWHGEHYGTRVYGAISRAEAQAMADDTCRRNP